MSATKTLWDQIIIVFAIVLIAVWDAMDGSAIGLPAATRAPWLELWPRIPVYVPPAFFWRYAYDAYAPRKVV